MTDILDTATCDRPWSFSNEIKNIGPDRHGVSDRFFTGSKVALNPLPDGGLVPQGGTMSTPDPLGADRTRRAEPES